MRWRLETVSLHPRFGSIAGRAIAAATRNRRWGSRLRNAIEFDKVEYGRALDGVVSPPANLSDEMAAIGLPQLSRLDADVTARNRLASLLEPLAQRLGWTTPRVDWVSTRPSFVRFPFLTDRRLYWQKRLAEVGIEVGTWLNHPLHPSGSSFEKCGYERGMCPNAEYVAQHILNIPVHPRCSGWILDRLERLYER